MNPKDNWFSSESMECPISTTSSALESHSGRQRRSQASGKTKTHTEEKSENARFNSSCDKCFILIIGRECAPSRGIWKTSDWRIKSHLGKRYSGRFPSSWSVSIYGQSETEMSLFRSLFCEHICASYVTHTVYTALCFMNQFHILSDANISITKAFQSK